MSIFAFLQGSAFIFFTNIFTFPPCLPLDDLTVVSLVAPGAPAPVDPLALPPVQTGNHTFAELAPRAVEPSLALAGVLLDALSTVHARLGTDSTLTCSSLITGRTLT